MGDVVTEILGPEGAIARRLGARYEHRPEQLELAREVMQAVNEGKHLLAEAGTGVGKSFAYLVPVIDWAVRNKKRVVVSTHTIALQEQLVEKDLPLIRAVFPEEFTAVLCKGRGNYLCRRRLDQARGRQGVLFDTGEERSQLSLIESWAAESEERGGEGSLSQLPFVPLPQVWDKVAAEAGNCMGKKCVHFKRCFWQSAKARMQTGNVLVVNHALFFSDLALRMSGVNYLPKYDVAVLDEAHTAEDVAGQHFGIKVSEASVKYNLRTLYDLRRGKGVLSTFGPVANGAIGCVVDLNDMVEEFFERAIAWQEEHGRSNGRIREAGIVENTLTPKLRELATRIRALIAHTESDEAIAELTSLGMRVETMAGSVTALVDQEMPDAVYWLEVGGDKRTAGRRGGQGIRRVTWHAAPVDVSEGIRRGLLGKAHSVVMTSATLCTSQQKRAGKARSMGGSPMSARATGRTTREGLRRGANLPHLESKNRVYHVVFRLADSLPQEKLKELQAMREQLAADEATLSPLDRAQLTRALEAKAESYLDAGTGECLMRRTDVAEIVNESLGFYDGERYRLLSWCVMPNHVHAVVWPMAGYELETITHTWKSYTAHKINELLGREGTLWQSESYDRLVRDEKELHAQVDYVYLNAERAGLSPWAWRGVDEDAIREVLGLGMGEDSTLRADHGRAAHATGLRDSTAENEAPHGPGARSSSGEGLDDTETKVPEAFSYLARRLGVGGDVAARTRFLQVGSPFVYERQCTLYVEAQLPDPADRLFAAAARERILHYLRLTQGGAFVLFTSYGQMTSMAASLRKEIEAQGWPLMVQGEGLTRKVLLERFKEGNHSVLFGTSSFWQGIDVQGEALRNVIIVKLPFAVPDEPLVEAKLEAITRDGGNAFMEFSVPEAIIKLKQGFGRLIRSKTDEGIVVILDSRVATKRYGRMFLEALPKCRVVTVERDEQVEHDRGHGDPGGQDDGWSPGVPDWL